MMAKQVKQIRFKAGQIGIVDSQGEERRQAIRSAYENPRYRYFVLGMLTFIYMFNFLDRQILNILGEYIIADLQLSDTQFGALSGIAFAAIYVTVGIPVAR